LENIDVDGRIVLIYLPTCGLGSRDSSVGIATGYRLDGQGYIPGREKKSFSTPQHPDWFWAHPASYPVGTGVSFPGGKAAGK
jgi:hypothetical protein